MTEHIEVIRVRSLTVSSLAGLLEDCVSLKPDVRITRGLQLPAGWSPSKELLIWSPDGFDGSGSQLVELARPKGLIVDDLFSLVLLAYIRPDEPEPNRPIIALGTVDGADGSAATLYNHRGSRWLRLCPFDEMRFAEARYLVRRSDNPG